MNNIIWDIHQDEIGNTFIRINDGKGKDGGWHEKQLLDSYLLAQHIKVKELEAQLKDSHRMFADYVKSKQALK